MVNADEPDRRTEQATPRRREEARELGRVPLSTELVAATMLAGWMLALGFQGGRLATSVGGLLASSLRSLGTLGPAELGAAGWVELLGASGRLAGGSLAALTLPLVLLGALAGYAQIGFRVTPRALACDPARVDPVQGARRLLGPRSLVRTALALVRTCAVAGVTAAIAWRQRGDIAALGGAELGPVLAGIGHVAARCAAGAVGVMLLLGGLDLGFQRFQHGRDLRMSRRELRDELRSTEGDPHLRGRLRRLQRELAARRGELDLPTATVVVTGAARCAVALRYGDEERARGSAPRVVARGVHEVAARIEALAREAGVPCCEQAALARALHARCGPGDLVPVELHEAVAGVLAREPRPARSRGGER